MSLGLGVEPNTYKIISYNQLTPDEVLKTNYPIRKLIFWDITASVPGKSAVDAPHVTVYWYGPNVSAEKGRIVHFKSIKIDPKFTESIRVAVARVVGGSSSEKEGGVEYKDFTMKINYEAIASLAKELERVGKLACEVTLEFGLVTKEEKAASTLPKTKVLGEKAVQE
ncbi:MAG: hypothetical protein ACRECH_14220 [Nitrososphaerales archaeon]